jgi:thioredoxin 1
MIEATQDTFDEMVEEGVVLVDFGATWCPPCRAMEPVLEEVTGAKIVKVDIDKEQDLALRFKVNAVPKFVFFKNGTLVEDVLGLQTLAFLQGKIDALSDEPEVEVFDEGNKTGESG